MSKNIVQQGLPLKAGECGACEVAEGAYIRFCALHTAAPRLLEACQEAQVALDVLADDIDEAGYPARAENATKLAMKLRQVVAAAEGRTG